ncbi:unnamed protein product [Rhizophagus irregularis]|nr:unnamed protein product [Rhizophagus irregularis]
MNFENPKNLWKDVDPDEYQYHVTISDIGELDERVVDIKDLEKREQVYGICGECNEPGTGSHWCRPCNAKRFKENFKNWTSGNDYVDELIQHAQLDASLDDSSCISTEFLNEIKSHLQIYLYDVIPCYGITQDPDTKDYMMVLEFYLPEPINSDCLDCQLDESTLREISQEQDDENSVE